MSGLRSLSFPHRYECARPDKYIILGDGRSLEGKEIFVEKVSDARDLDPDRNVTHVSIRQIELISNDLTSLYRSALGDVFNTSISDYITSVA